MRRSTCLRLEQRKSDHGRTRAGKDRFGLAQQIASCGSVQVAELVETREKECGWINLETIDGQDKPRRFDKNSPAAHKWV